MTGRLLSLGSVLVDLTVRVPHLPEPGGDVLASGAASHVGGGFNLLVAARRQGVETVHPGRLGSGPYGDLARAALDAAGVGWSGAPDPRGDTGVCVTLLDPHGHPTFVTAPGVEATLTRADLDPVRVGPADVVALSGYDLLYPVAGPALLDWAADLAPVRQHGPRLALDPGPLVADLPDPVWRRLGPRLDVLTVNRREADLLTGEHGDDAVRHRGVRDRCRLAARCLLVVRDGPAGCTHSLDGDRPHRTPAPTVDVVDTTGAGDAHTGVLLAGLVQGRPAVEALRRATVAASLSVTRAGPAACPDAHTIDAALGIRPVGRDEPPRERSHDGGTPC